MEYELTPLVLLFYLPVFNTGNELSVEKNGPKND